jgi:hypothetical protein
MVQHLDNRLAIFVEVTRGAPGYKSPQNTSPALRLNEGHKLADFYSATTAKRSRFCGPILLRVLHLAIGHQDTDILGLSLPVGTKLIGATSDHLVVETSRLPLPVGSEVKIQMNYSALMHAMAAPDIDISLQDDPPTGFPRRTEGKFGHLVQV